MSETEITETLAERGGKYGDFRDNARISQNLKRAMQDTPNWSIVPPYIREALDLIAMKISRLLSGDPLYMDNAHDIIGYATLIEDRQRQDIERGLVIQGPGDPLYPEYKHEEKTVIEAFGVTIPNEDVANTGYDEDFLSYYRGKWWWAYVYDKPENAAFLHIWRDGQLKDGDGSALLYWVNKKQVQLYSQQQDLSSMKPAPLKVGRFRIPTIQEEKGHPVS